MAEVPTSKSVIEGTTAQLIGCGIAYLYVVNEASKQHFFPAGAEVILGNFVGAIFYILWKVLGPRVINWATDGGKLPEVKE